MANRNDTVYHSLYLKRSLLQLKSIMQKGIQTDCNPYISLYADFLKTVCQNYNLSAIGMQNLLTMILSFDLDLRSGKDISNILTAYLQDVFHELDQMQVFFCVPGYDCRVQVGHVEVHAFGGNISSGQKPMERHALFDIASMTKVFTQIVIYSLIQEGYFSYTSKIKDLDSRFSSIGDITIEDITRFMVSFHTPVRIDSVSTVEEAKSILFGTTSSSKGIFQYNDIGMMILKEVVESVTHETYDQLVKRYVVEPLSLHDTYLHVPFSSFDRITGTPNAEVGLPNDPKAVAFEGLSGHAGIFASTYDLNRLGKSLVDGSFLHTNTNHLFFQNQSNFDRSDLFGNVFLHKWEQSNFWVRPGFPVDTLAYLGSTRVTGIYSRLVDSFGKLFYMQSTLGLNPASMDYSKAWSIQKEMNAKIAQENAFYGIDRPYFNGIKTYTMNGKVCYLIDSRVLVSASSMGRMNDLIATLELKMLLIDCFLKHQMKHCKVLQDHIFYETYRLKK